MLTPGQRGRGSIQTPWEDVMAEALRRPDAPPSTESTGRSNRLWEAIRVALHGRADVPTNPVIARILALSELKPGWNTYSAGRIAESAQLQAIAFVNSFEEHGRIVPPPSAVAPLANRGVALVWRTQDREIEVRFFPEGHADYSVSRRVDDEVVEEGSLSSVDPLKDIVDAHVLGRRSLAHRF